MAFDKQCQDCVRSVLAKLGYSDDLQVPAPQWLQGYAEYLCYFRFSQEEIVLKLKMANAWDEVFEVIKKEFPHVTGDELAEIEEQFKARKISRAEALDLANGTLGKKRTFKP